MLEFLCILSRFQCLTEPSCSSFVWLFPDLPFHFAKNPPRQILIIITNCSLWVDVVPKEPYLCPHRRWDLACEDGHHNAHVPQPRPRLDLGEEIQFRLRTRVISSPKRAVSHC